MRPARVTFPLARQPLHTALRTTLIPTRHASGFPTGLDGRPVNPFLQDTEPSIFSYAWGTIRPICYTILAMGAAGVLAFEGRHMYIEHVCMAAPSGEDGDAYGWTGEVQGWTGGPRGGTDPRLGFVARHALRAAWVEQEWGSGSVGWGAVDSVPYSSPFQPDSVAVRGMITPATAQGDNGQRANIPVDRGYERADEYLDIVIQKARTKGILFPPTLSGARPPGPPTDGENKLPQSDPTAIDLLLLKAGLLERMGTIDSLVLAKDLYEQVFSSLHSTCGPDVGPGEKAKVMRLAGKVGDLCARTGGKGEAIKWWAWGLARVGVDLESLGVETANKVKRSKLPLSQSTLPTPTATSLPPPVLRATISLLLSTSSQLAASSHLPSASTLQSLALSLLPAPPVPSLSPSPSPSAALHSTWITHRDSLLRLHLASVLYATTKTPSEGLPLVSEAQLEVERVIKALNPLPNQYDQSRSPLGPSARVLVRDALLTGAEIAYTKGVFIERTAPSPPSASFSLFSSTKETAEVQKERTARLETALECFERALALSAEEYGADRVQPKEGEEVSRGNDWERYHRALVRVQAKMAEGKEAGI